MLFREPILHVDMDAFFVEVERLRNPKLRGIPVVVGGGASRGVVASASYEARLFGVHSAMPTAHARRRCRQLTVVPPDHDEYQRVSELVFELFRSVTPLVEGLSLDEAFLDVSGLARHYDHSADIGRQIRSRIRAELGLPASVGVASTKFVAKLASESAKPDGLRHVPRDQTLEFLHALPIRALWGVGEATHASLEGLGITTVGDLAQLPVNALAHRLGLSNAQHLAALAAGVDPRQVTPDREAKSISVSETYDSDLTSREQIETELLRLCNRLVGRLRRGGMGCHTVGLTVRYFDFVTISRHVTFDHVVDTGHGLWQTVKSLMKKVDFDRAVRLLGVTCSGLIDPGSPRQLSTDGAPKWNDLAEAVDNVRSRFGAASVVPARLARDDGAQQASSQSRETRSKTRRSSGSN